MSLTRFAIATSIAGLALSWALLAMTLLGSVESMPILIALFVGIFFAFGSAVLSHPKHRVDPGLHTTVSVSWYDILKSAPLWSTTLVVLSFAVLLAACSRLPESRFTISSAELAGRPDRVRVLLTFFATFYAFGLQIGLSAHEENKKLPYALP